MWYRIVISLILLGVLGYIASRAINVHDLPQVIMSLPKIVLTELLLISSIISILKAWRFMILLRNSQIKVKFIEVLRSFLAAQAVTPLPGGEAMRGILLHKETGAKILKTTGPVITQAYLELFSCSVLTLIGSFVYQQFRIPALIVLIVLLCIAYLLVSKKTLKSLNTKLTRFKKLHTFFAKMTKAQEGIRVNFIDEESGLPDKVLVRVFAISLITNILGGVLIFLTASAYQTHLSIIHCTFIYAASQAIQGIGMISPGGIGFTESGMMGLLLVSGVDITKALAIVLIFRAITLLFNTLTGLIFLTIFYGKSLLFTKHTRLRGQEA